MFKYDKSPLNIKVIKDSIDNGEVWYKKVVEIDAAYGKERLPLNVFIPKNESPIGSITYALWKFFLWHQLCFQNKQH